MTTFAANASNLSGAPRRQLCQSDDIYIAKHNYVTIDGLIYSHVKSEFDICKGHWRTNITEKIKISE